MILLLGQLVVLLHGSQHSFLTFGLGLLDLPLLPLLLLLLLSLLLFCLLLGLGFLLLLSSDLSLGLLLPLDLGLGELLLLWLGLRLLNLCWVLAGQGAEESASRGQDIVRLRILWLFLVACGGGILLVVGGDVGGG